MRSLCIVLALVASAACQTPPNEPDRPLDAVARHRIVDAIALKVSESYVYPDLGVKIAAFVRRRDKDGAYNSLSGSMDFAEALTSDLESVNNDRHLRVFEGAPPMRRPGNADPGYAKPERLAGNVAYLEVRGFAPRAVAQDAGSAAMSEVADAAALIIDVRRNGGGDPTGVAFLCSYLFGSKPVHLNDLYWRPANRIDQFWTDPGVPGRRYGPGKPVYVLTSRRTFSAAEEFAYDLQQLKRAIIVGETTGGGAHPGGVQQVGNGFSIFIPTGRAINPVSKKDWEGSGVIPDIPVPAAEGLETARAAALRALASKAAP